MGKFPKKSLLSVCLAAMLSLGVSAQAADLKFKPGEDTKRFHWDSYEALKKTDLKGEKITVFGPWVGADKDLIESVLEYFRQATGAEVEYTGSNSFEQKIVIDTQAGSASNIAIFPQPGLASDLAAKGLLTPLGDDTKNWVKDNYSAGQSWVDLGTYKNKEGKDDFYGFFFKVDLKSLVWYSPENFEDAGYKVPESMEDLKALTEKMVADGHTPWCIGLGSGDATGWPATDWVEDLMLRTQKPDVYDKWVKNEVKFDDAAVTGAIDEFGWFARNPKFADGGASGVASTDFRDSPKGLFASPPKCYLHRQASFVSTFFPEGTKLGEDADFFYFPAYKEKDLGKPVLGAGTLFAITKESKGARALIDFLKTPIAHEVWMAQSGFLTPFKGVNADAYANDTLKKQGQILLDATTFRFDGSDLMPGKIGAGAFWTGMIDYVGGKDSKEVGASIQKTWDALKK
ncbi:ABC transporter substrate-binding protein [Thiolinea disciformis]|uniref:ABC transporter substrate-binding protein n=1 Tax=Thiolinea disciformis TaxID=125614 RepID=UPI00036E98B1|nr:ABC transporter substrate-binding protein [Thiolinea disciformis]